MRVFSHSFLLVGNAVSEWRKNILSNLNLWLWGCNFGVVFLLKVIGLIFWEIYEFWSLWLRKLLYKSSIRGVQVFINILKMCRLAWGRRKFRGLCYWKSWWIWRVCGSAAILVIKEGYWLLAASPLSAWEHIVRSAWYVKAEMGLQRHSCVALWISSCTRVILVRRKESCFGGSRISLHLAQGDPWDRRRLQFCTCVRIWELIFAFKRFLRGNWNPLNLTFRLGNSPLKVKVVSFRSRLYLLWKVLSNRAEKGG